MNAFKVIAENEFYFSVEVRNASGELLGTHKAMKPKCKNNEDAIESAKSWGGFYL